MTVDADGSVAAIELLLVEDSAQDAELILDALQEAGLAVQANRVEDEAAYCAALTQRLPDAILSDWSLPRFSGERAFAIAREVCPVVPFIFVSGTISETAAISVMRQGAIDFIFKHQLQLLSLALQRALQEVRSRRALESSHEAQKRHALRAEALLSLSTASESMNEKEFMQYGLELAEHLTGSQIAFIHFVNVDQETIDLVSWSRGTQEHYRQDAFDGHLPVSQAGIWTDALRQRQLVVINDYVKVRGKHGQSEVHAHLERLISVPVIQVGLVRMLAGVGNKRIPYTDWDVETVRLLADAIWFIVRQRRSDAALRESEKRHRLLADNAVDVIWTMDLQGRFTYISPSVEKLRGFTSAEVLQQTIEQALCPDSAAIAKDNLGQSLRALNAGLPFIEFKGELEQPCKDGTTVWTEVNTSGMRSEDGAFVGIIGVTRDITVRKMQQERINLSAQVFSQSREGITLTDLQGNIVMVNPAFTEVTGYSAAEALGQNPRILKSGRQDAAFYLAMWDQIVTTGHWEGEIWNRNKNGTVYPEWLSISTLHDQHGSATHYMASFSDLSASKAAENRIQWLSHFDTLTGLPNRTLLQDRADQAISMVQRSNEPLAVMFVSIDHFTSITDTLGFQGGDDLLKEMAQRLVACVRAQDTVARLAGKEFVLLLPGTNASGAAHLADLLLSSLAQPFVHNKNLLNLTCSLGIASYPENAANFDDLLRAAQVAMHRAQTQARGSYQFYNPDMYQAVLAHEKMVKALRQAAALDQLHLVYQPQVDLGTGNICGLEALLRWTHPELGVVPPGEFIPVAEDAGLIIAIGEWVLRRACRDIRNWLDKGIRVPHVAINVSPLQFHENDLLGQVKSALAEWQIDPTLIYIEVTESALMTDAARSEAMFRDLNAFALKLSLDDFGTGYSSLSYLKRFPFDQVKIDQSFVRDIATDSSDMMLVKVIVSMAHGFGMKVIAEGVETEAQCEILRASICDEIQGYFFSRPLSKQAVEELFSEGRQLPAHLLRAQPPLRTVLLVDDEPNIVTSIKRLFRRDGYVILTAKSGEEGLEVLAKHKVDLIISDQRMQGMSGVEFLRKAKTNYPDTVRIVLSGFTELQSVTDAINEGAVYRFLTKPWEDEELREQIRNALEHKNILDENQQLDIQIQGANRELVAANRQLSDLLKHKGTQIEQSATSLSIAREALEQVLVPVLGVDEAGMVVLVNSIAQDLLMDKGDLIGATLSHALPGIQDVMADSMRRGECTLLVKDTRYCVQWRSVGMNTPVSGKLITLLQFDSSKRTGSQPIGTVPIND